MVQIVEGKTSAFGRLGKSFGEALSEQLPAEIDRRRLSQGLKQLGESSATSSPFELLSGLYAQPGMTDAKAQALYPTLREQIQRNAQIQSQQNRTAGGPVQASAQMNQQLPQNIVPGQPQMSGGQIQQPQQGQEPAQGQQQAPAPSIVSAANTAARQKAFVPLTREQERSAAINLMNERPLEFPNFDAAEQEIKNQQISAKEQFQVPQIEYAQQKEIQQEVEKEFEKILSKKLQATGEDTYSSVLGALQEDFKKKAFADVRDGILSPSQAGDKYGQEALDFAKTVSKLKGIGAQSAFTGDKESNMKSFGEIRKKFDQYGRLEDFADMLQSTQNLTPHYAREIAYPIKENKEVYNTVGHLKDRLSGFARTPRNAEPISAKEMRKISDDIASKMSPNDSPLSIALALNKKGYDEQAFLDRVRELSDQGQVKLLPEHMRELETPGKIRESMGDLWLTTWLTGMKPINL